MTENKYVIKSGYGYLKNSKTGEMIAHRTDPQSVIIEAEKFTFDQANVEVEKMISRGLDVTMVKI